MADFLTYVLSNPGLAMFALLMVIFAITATCILFVGLIFLLNILLDKTKSEEEIRRLRKELATCDRRLRESRRYSMALETLKGPQGL